MILFFLYIIISPLTWFFLVITSIFNFKIRRHFWNNKNNIQSVKSKFNSASSNKILIVLHAASAGEYEQLKPILKVIDRDKYFILVTFFSPTILEKEKDTELADSICYHPFDLPWTALYFFLKLKPQKYIITRHDIWPIHVFIARLLDIETIFINANLYQSSNRFHFGLKSFNNWLFRQFDIILTGSENLKKTILSLSPNSKVIVTGDSRFDQVINRAKSFNKKLLPSVFENSKNIIFGSTVESDLPVIADTLDLLKPNFFNENKLLIIVPHEIDKESILLVQKILQKRDLSFQKLSEFDEEILSLVLIVDTVGILADLYSYAQIAYVGAGFSTGVHSVIEPAIHKCIVSYGPYIDILDEAVEMTKFNAGHIINSGEELRNILEKINNSKEISALGNDAYKFVLERGDASKRIIDVIFN